MRTNIAVSIATVGLTLTVGLALADGLRTPPVTDPVVKKECSACHMAYPAGLLPARSWQAVMANLKDHFGENAELDAETTKRVTDYLVAGAADQGRSGKLMRDLSASQTPRRVSELPWFVRKHERKGRISPESLKRRGAKSAANCNACHKGAEQGVFDDD